MLSPNNLIYFIPVKAYLIQTKYDCETICRMLLLEDIFNASALPSDYRIVKIEKKYTIFST